MNQNDTSSTQVYVSTNQDQASINQFYDPKKLFSDVSNLLLGVPKQMMAIFNRLTPTTNSFYVTINQNRAVITQV
jgi:hypothetical protein